MPSVKTDIGNVCMQPVCVWHRNIDSVPRVAVAVSMKTATICKTMAAIQVALNGSKEHRTTKAYNKKLFSNIPVALCIDAELCVLVSRMSNDIVAIIKNRKRTLFCSVADMCVVMHYFYTVRG